MYFVSRVNIFIPESQFSLLEKKKKKKKKRNVSLRPCPEADSYVRNLLPGDMIKTKVFRIFPYCVTSSSLFFSSFFSFLGLYPQHIEISRLGVESELQPWPKPHPQQLWILNPLNEARVEPASSWMLVRFFSTEPRRELPSSVFSVCASLSLDQLSTHTL